jgi:serine/threonine protein kinase
METQLAIPPSITIGKKLGKGQSGEVYEGSFVDPRDNKLYEPVAIKVIKLLSNFPSLVEKQREEVRIVQSILNSNALQEDTFEDIPIVRIYSHIEFNDNLFVIMEKSDGDGELFQQIIDKLKQDNKYYKVYELIYKNLIQLCKGLNVIHTNCVIHRDIKPANLLFNKKSKKLKLADFGMSCFHKKCKGLAGTPNFIDPICFLEEKLNKKLKYENKPVKCVINQWSDIYSLGVTILFMILPYSADKNILFNTIRSGAQVAIEFNNSNFIKRLDILEKNKPEFKKNKIIEECNQQLSRVFGLTMDSFFSDTPESRTNISYLKSLLESSKSFSLGGSKSRQKKRGTRGRRQRRQQTYKKRMNKNRPAKLSR